MKNGVYVINFDEYESIGTHGIAFYVNNNTNNTNNNNNNNLFWDLWNWKYSKRN